MPSPAAAQPEPDVAMAVAALERQYWRRVRTLTLVLLALWLSVTVTVPWFARDLNRWSVDRFPLGFWLNAQGAIVVFVALIGVYAWVMDRLDRAFLTDRHRLEAGSSVVSTQESPLDAATWR